MPEHVHLLLSEPIHHPLATTLKILKQETAKHLLGPRAKFWQDRYFDFNVRTEAKRIEKLKYIHRNPLKRGLTQRPEDYPWSSAHHYATGTPGTIHLASHWTTHPPPRHAKRRVPPSWQSHSGIPANFIRWADQTMSGPSRKARSALPSLSTALTKPPRRAGAPFMAVSPP